MRRSSTLLALAVMSIPATTAWAEAPQAAGVPDVVAGRVFLDANGNGQLDPGEQGIGGVRVTDGVGFAATGPDGAYRLRIMPDIMLPIPGTQPVTVCWPSGAWPTGRYWFRVKDMPDAANMNFGLREDRAQKLPFTYLHVSDNHDWRASQYEHQHETANLYLREARFILNTGDMGFGGATPEGMAARGAELTAHRALNSMPTFGAIGNHDTDNNYGKDHEYNFCGGYVKFLGPLRFSFDYAGVHFALVDVIGDKQDWNDFAAAWMEKDFAALQPGTRIILSYHYPNPESSRRFKKVIADYKVELVHAGHNHAYVRGWDWPAPMVTAYARTSGSANVMVVDRTGTHVGFFCDGCSSGRGSHSFSHSNRCPVKWREHVLEPCIKGLYGQSHKVEGVKLSGAAQPVAVTADAVYVSAEFAPGAAGSVGVRLGEGKGLEVALAGAHLVVDGVPMPFLIPKQDKTLKLHVYAHKDMLTVWANECFFYEKPVKFARTGTVTAFAAGGQATLLSMDVQELKPDKTRKGYFCSCAHGALIWNPD